MDILRGGEKLSYRVVPYFDALTRISILYTQFGKKQDKFLSFSAEHIHVDLDISNKLRDIYNPQNFVCVMADIFLNA